MPDVTPKRILFLNTTLYILTCENKLILGELTWKGEKTWSVDSKSYISLGKDERRVLDMAILSGNILKLKMWTPHT